jgi:hypothetical protein
MRDLQNSAAMWFKAFLFLIIGATAGILLILELRSWRGAVLLGLTIWAFCRAYYFAFYVIEKYVDPTYRFAGLFSVLRYLLGRKPRQ